MKRSLVLATALLLCVLFTLTALATGGTTPDPNTPVVDGSVTVVNLTAVRPIAGESVADSAVKAGRVRATRGEIDTMLTQRTDPASTTGQFSLQYVWEKETFASMDDPDPAAMQWVAMAGTDVFAENDRYRVTVTMEFFPEAGKVYEMASSAAVLFNGKSPSDTGSTVTVSNMENNVITITATYMGIKTAATPLLQVTYPTGTCKKNYNGDQNPWEISAELLNPVADYDYRYEWRRGPVNAIPGDTNDPILLPEWTSNKARIINVADTGAYSVRVVATPTGAVEGEGREFASEWMEAGTYEIFTIPVTIVADEIQKNLFDADPILTYTILEDQQPFDPLTGELLRVEGEDVGEYDILQGTLGFAPEKAGNYEINFIPSKLVILPIGELPFNPVTGFADVTRISGKNGAVIRVMATLGAIPGDAVFSLFSAPSAAVTELEKRGKSVMKAFTVSLTDEDGNALSLASHAKFRFYIPLTEAEESQKVETITAALYQNGIYDLDVTVETGAVTYLVVTTDVLGVVALYDGEAGEVPPPSSDDPTTPPATGSQGGGENTGAEPAPEPEPEDEDGLSFLWILLIVLLCIALILVVVAAILQKKADKHGEGAPSAPVIFPVRGEKNSDHVEEIFQSSPEEKMKNRRLAEKMNTLSPLGEEVKNKEKKPPATPPRKVISFEDLEEE